MNIVSMSARPFNRAGVLTILCVSGMHLYQALLMIIWPSAMGATATLAMHLVEMMIYQPDGVRYIIAAMVMSALLGTAGAMLRLGWVRYLILVPQHLFLGIMAFGGLLAIWEGHYLDLTVIPSPHIAADQAGYQALFVAHTFAIVKRCWEQE